VLPEHARDGRAERPQFRDRRERGGRGRRGGAPRAPQGEAPAVESAPVADSAEAQQIVPEATPEVTE
jgi:hypothetical protein